MGCSLITHRIRRASADLELQIKVSKELGFGATWGPRWIIGYWDWSNRRHSTNSLAALELIGLIVAIKTWGDLLQRCRIEFETRNMAVARAGRSWLPRDRLLAHLMRHLAASCIKHNIELRFKYSDSLPLGDADLLANGNLPLFSLKNPNSDRNPSPFPSEWIDTLLNTDFH